MKKFILIDGNAIIHRAFHALPPFKTSGGELVNAVYGFTSMLLNILNNEKPEYIAVSFDTAAKTFRHEEYKDYKATRTKAPDELYAQIPRIKEIVKTFNIPIYEMDGFEADDVLGTLAKQINKLPNIVTYIATGDMDILQLVNERTKILAPFRGFKETITYDLQKVLGKYGLKPEQIADMKGLQGDSSDNIKGVSGIGPKTTKILLQKYGSLENIYENIDEIEGKIKEKLLNDKENAFLSKRLATIITDIDIKLDVDECKTHEYNKNQLIKLFEHLEFKSLINRLKSFDKHYSEEKKVDNNQQGVLF